MGTHEDGHTNQFRRLVCDLFVKSENKHLSFKEERSDLLT